MRATIAASTAAAAAAAVSPDFVGALAEAGEGRGGTEEEYVCLVVDDRRRHQEEEEEDCAQHTHTQRGRKRHFSPSSSDPKQRKASFAQVHILSRARVKAGNGSGCSM